MSVILCRSDFGKTKNPKTLSCENVEKFTWKTSNLLEISLVTFGAEFIEVKAPDRHGNIRDILMGYNSLEDIVNDGKNIFGSIIGPVIGIIKNAEFCIKGKICRLKRNLKNIHCVDSGINGLHRVNWTPHVDGSDLILSHATDGSDGFPGILLIQIFISVNYQNCLIIGMTARSNKVTPIDLSYRFYFNLASHDSGSEEFLNHMVMMQSSEYSERNKDGIFKKSMKNLLGSEKDFRELSEIKKNFTGCETFDLLYKTNSSDEKNCKFRSIHVNSGRVLEIFTNQNFLHFSSCPEFPESGKVFKREEENLTLEYLRTKLTEKKIEFFKCRVDSDQVDVKSKTPQKDNYFNGECLEVKEEKVSEVIGKNKAKYFQNSGFSISCHNFPNAVNHQQKYPKILLKPGQVYENFMTIKFGVHVEKKPIKPHPIKITSCYCESTPRMHV